MNTFDLNGTVYLIDEAFASSVRCLVSGSHGFVYLSPSVVASAPRCSPDRFETPAQADARARGAR